MKPKRTFVEVQPWELMNDLRLTTGDAALATKLMREVLNDYVLEADEEISLRKGLKTTEDVQRARNIRRDRRRHSYNLRKNMELAGRSAPRNTAAHHIVAWDDPRAMRARIILKQVGIDIDDEVNGVYLPSWRKHTPHQDLPSAYAHLTVHTNYYYLNVTAMLRSELDSGGEREDIEDILRAIARRLTDGTYPLHSPLPPGSLA